MKGIALALAALAATGCSTSSTYLEVGAGHNGSFFQERSDLQWDDGDGVGFYGSLRHEVPVHDRVDLVLQYSHYSQWDVGPPFNDRAESSLDHIGAAARFRLHGD